MIAGGAQRAFEAACLDDALGRELECATRGSPSRDRARPGGSRSAQLEHDLGARDRRVVGDLLLTAEHGEERAVRALGAIELTVVARELGERAQDLRIRRIDARRRVELDERPRAIADREIEPREVIVDRRALLRPPSAERVDERAEERASLFEAPGRAERVGERELDGVVVGREIGGLLEQRDGALGLARPAAMELGGLAQAREARRLVGRVRRAVGEELGERAPGLRGAVHLGETHADVIRLRDRARPRSRGAAARRGSSGRGDERVGEAERDRRARGPVGHLAQSIEVARGALVIACRRREARERVERAGARLELDDATKVRDRARRRRRASSRRPRRRARGDRRRAWSRRPPRRGRPASRRAPRARRACRRARRAPARCFTVAS